MPAIRLDQPRLQIGGRKNDAKDRGIVDSLQVDVTVKHISMMLLAENIPATYPQYATVTPIFPRPVCSNRKGRGITPNTGAAA